MLVRVFIIAAILFGAWNWWTHRPVAPPPPGVVVRSEPIQAPVKEVEPIKRGDFQIKPLAGIELEARVLGVKQYSTGREAEVSPLDLAVGWGPMSDSSVLERINISQGNRFYYWSTRDFPIPRREIERNSTNMHMIPATPDLEAKLRKVRQGQVVSVKGKLVEVKAPDGWHWKSSLTRDDTGDGACEVVYVEDLVLM